MDEEEGESIAVLFPIKGFEKDLTEHYSVIVTSKGLLRRSTPFVVKNEDGEDEIVVCNFVTIEEHEFEDIALKFGHHRMMIVDLMEEAKLIRKYLKIREGRCGHA